MPHSSRAKRVLIPYRHPTKLIPYENAVWAVGIEPIPVLTSGIISLDNASGLLLMGGTDVDPKRYGQMLHTETDQPDEERDEVELALIDSALKRDIPILAICRGIQILNVYHGGTLIQHLSNLADHRPEVTDKSAPVHTVDIEPRTLLARITGVNRWAVNSRHHQAIAQVGEGLQVAARHDQDGTVEALERPDKSFVLGVQWHPEDQMAKCPEQLKLFQHFAEALEIRLFTKFPRDPVSDVGKPENMVAFRSIINT